MELIKHILLKKTRANPSPSLESMGISPLILDRIYRWGVAHAKGGSLPTYIPELSQVNPDLYAVCLGDTLGNLMTCGNGTETPISIQSVIKPFLYAYALHLGVAARQISHIEATSIPFSSDAVMYGPNRLPGHPYNNAGAISSAGFIPHFDAFLNFMRSLTDNPALAESPRVFESEMSCNANNRALAFRLAATERFQSLEQAKQALVMYTRACSIEVSIEEITRACAILANGGRAIRGQKKQLIEEDAAVRTINAMNSFGLYEHTAELTLMAAGTRALSSKSGVGGLIVNIDPGRGAFATYSPRLDESGNSVFGKLALIPLNLLLSSPDAMRLSAEALTNHLSVEVK